MIPILSYRAERKTGAVLSQTPVEPPIDRPADRYVGTNFDQRDMSRMGKRQELKRNFRFYSIVGFVVVLESTWEAALLNNNFGLLNGGTAGMIWMSIAVAFCIMALVACLGEMASMAPTSGGQYHWVSEFAPEKYQGILSYITGWLCCWGWITGVPASIQNIVTMLQGMLKFTKPETDLSSLWITSLLIYVFLLFAFISNIFLAKYLPLAEGIFLFIHVIGFWGCTLAFWILPTHISSRDVFTQTYNGGGWSNIELSTLVGIATPLWCYIGPDAGVHMSEELQDASIQLPKAMMWSALLNSIMGTSMLITFCYCVSDISELLQNSVSGVPVLDVAYAVTGSTTGVCVIGALLSWLALFSAITQIAAASRQTWAFARDGGFPYSKWIAHVRPGWNIPLNAILVCAICSFAVTTINFGSTVALNAIISVSNGTLIFSYFISIGCVRLKRLRGQKLLPRRFDLGRWGAPLNDITLLFLAISFIFSFFPESPPAHTPAWAAAFNWASLMFVGVTALSLAIYWLGGKERYVPPVRLVKLD